MTVQNKLFNCHYQQMQGNPDNNGTAAGHRDKTFVHVWDMSMMYAQKKTV